MRERGIAAAGRNGRAGLPPARVVQVYAEEGIRVQEGQTLAILDDADARVRLTSAKADKDATAAALADLEVQSANPDRELRRTQTLEKQGVSSTEALDNARTTAHSLRAKIARQNVLAAGATVSVVTVLRDTQ